MRKQFIQTLSNIASKDKRVILLTGDLGYSVLEPFREALPDRFFNVGVAEQNMVGLAAGLAAAGMIPFVYSIATFASLRAYEFIRNGPILNHLPVRIVGTGEGFEYGESGITHYSLEDVGVMRLQPGITIVAPADYRQAQTALRRTWQLPGPVYYRLSKRDDFTIDRLNGRFALGRLRLVRRGRDVILFSLGSISREAVAAAKVLARESISCAVAIISSFNPSPVNQIEQLLKKFRLAVTVEAHYLSGGVGSLVAEVLATGGYRCKLVRCGVSQSPHGISGSEAYLNEKHGLVSQKIAKLIIAKLRQR